MRYDHDSPDNPDASLALRIRIVLYLAGIALFAYSREWTIVAMLALIGVADLTLVALYKKVMRR